MIDLLLFAGIEPTGTMFQTINNLLLQHQFRGESVNVSEELRIGGCFYDQSNLYSIRKIPAAAQRATASINLKIFLFFKKTCSGILEYCEKKFI